MFVGNVNYEINNCPISMHELNRIRYYLLLGVYPNEYFGNELKKCIANKLDCLNIDYDPVSYTVTIKVKKTGLKKSALPNDFYRNPRLYYERVISDALNDLLFNNELISDSMKNILRIICNSKEEYFHKLEFIKNNKLISANLCQLSYISDNILILKL